MKGKENGILFLVNPHLTPQESCSFWLIIISLFQHLKAKPVDQG
jgi:hypothetical protein